MRTDELPAGATDARIETAIVHEWIGSRAGSEKVFEALAGIFSNADLIALTRDPEVALELGGRDVLTSWLDRPALRDRRSVILPMMPLAWSMMFGDYELVISSSHAFSRWYRPARSALHLSYVHTPLRYVWAPGLDKRGRNLRARLARRPLRFLDRMSLKWTDSLAANSTETQRRISTYYGRTARLIFPPVDIERFLTLRSNEREGLLYVGRLVWYKRPDLAIRAAHLTGEMLTVAGAGPMEPELKSLASRLDASVEFVISPSDATIDELYTRHRLLLFPGLEDFGIVPVEAAAAGLPVIAYGKGGALDTVLSGGTGLFVNDQTAPALADRISGSRSIEWDEDQMRQHAERFAPIRFRDAILDWVNEAIDARQVASRS